MTFHEKNIIHAIYFNNNNNNLNLVSSNIIIIIIILFIITSVIIIIIIILSLLLLPLLLLSFSLMVLLLYFFSFLLVLLKTGEHVQYFVILKLFLVCSHLHFTMICYVKLDFLDEKDIMHNRETRSSYTVYNIKEYLF